MSRPVDMPPAERFAHGTRARYVGGCRCDDCRASNCEYYHARQAAKRAAAPAVAPSGPPLEGVLVRAGREYRIRRCPGANGAPCVRSPATWLRVGEVCDACVERASVWNGPVPVAAVRRHLLKLRRAGVGYKSVAAACDVAASTLARALRGEGTIRAATAKRVLAVTAAAISDHATVDGRATWALLEELLAAGWTRAELARRLGRKTPALQVGRARVLARTALQVRRLHAALVDEEPRRATCECARPIPLEREGASLCARCERPARSEAAA